MNRIEEGMNERNTDVTKPFARKEREALKPIQHPFKLDSSDTNIVSYKVPPKALSPYDSIPELALAPLNIPCKDSP
jgi:hypothetical protein